MGIALSKMIQEDPSFYVETNEESGETIMKGMGELHLDILVDRLKREFKVEANIGAPQVAYRETIGHEVEHTYTHKKQSGGKDASLLFGFSIPSKSIRACSMSVCNSGSAFSPSEKTISTSDWMALSKPCNSV